MSEAQLQLCVQYWYVKGTTATGMSEAQLQLCVQHWYVRGTIAIVDLTLVCQRHNCNCGFNTSMSEAQLQLRI